MSGTPKSLSLLAGILSLGSGCFDNRPACVPGADPGDLLEVTLHERTRDPAHISGPPPPECGLPDLAPGMTFTVRLTGDELNLRECVLPTCSDDFPNESLPLTGDRPLVSAGSGTLCTNRHRKVRLSNDCEATRVVELVRTDNGAADLFDSSPSQPPKVVFVRRLGVSPSHSGAKCDNPSQVFPPPAQRPNAWWTCSDAFAVALAQRAGQD